jgi:hypothetical protein
LQVFVKLECLLVVENLHVCCRGVIKPKNEDTEPGSGGENQPSIDSLAVPGSPSILREASDSEQDRDDDPDFIPDTDESDSETSVVPDSDTDHATDGSEEFPFLHSFQTHDDGPDSLACASGSSSTAVRDIAGCPAPDSTTGPAADSATHHGSSIHVLNSSQTKSWVCMFCSKPQKKLPRHLTHVHPDEELVREYLQCKDKQMKSKLLTRIRSRSTSYIVCKYSVASGCTCVYSVLTLTHVQTCTW